MEKPQRDEPAGAYKANSAVRLVSPPIELIDQRGGDRLDVRVHVFERCLHTRAVRMGKSALSKLENWYSVRQKRPVGSGRPKNPDSAISCRRQ